MLRSGMSSLSNAYSSMANELLVVERTLPVIKGLPGTGAYSYCTLS